MKRKVSQKELAEIRRRAQERKELEFQIERDVKLESRRMDAEDRFFENKNRLVIAALNFFGTLMVGHAIKAVVTFFNPLAGLFSSAINVLILGIAIISAFRRRSLLDEFF